jgi:hypothetical protein
VGVRRGGHRNVGCVVKGGVRRNLGSFRAGCAVVIPGDRLGQAGIVLCGNAFIVLVVTRGFAVVIGALGGRPRFAATVPVLAAAPAATSAL